MNIKYKNIEDFRKEFYKKFPNSEIKIIKLLPNKKVKVQDKYGFYVYSMKTIFYYGVTSIKCALNKTEVFINKVKEMHGEKYDYSITEYKGALVKLKIICKKHGEFEQLANSHLSGNGCKKCGKLQRDKSCTKSVDYYIESINKIHNNNYSINKEDYINLKTSIPHYCNTQKEWFNMRPYHVISGQSCRKCGNNKISKRSRETSVGWSYSKWEQKGKQSNHFEAFQVYIIRCISSDEDFYKIGKTFQNIKRRFQSKKEIPYDWEIVKLFKGEALDMSKLEKKLKSINKSSNYKPKLKFNGMYECYSKIIIEDEEFFTCR